MLALAKRARRTVGFLPDSAFAERARQGTLLVYLDDARVAGYLLYDLPRDEIRIVHLVVASNFRRRGMARTLVDAVADTHPDRRGMVLHCRNDFPAHSLWPHLDFIPLGERPGRSFEGKPLTRWFRSFGQPDLFSILEEADTRPVATMDACVFFDLVASRPKSVSRRLRDDWLGEHVRLAVTDQLLVEIAHGRDPAERRRQREAVEPFRLPSQPGTTWRPIFREILRAHPEAPAKDHTDLMHVAQSVAHQARWLITADRSFIRRYAVTASEIGGLELVSPTEFLRVVDEGARGDQYRPVDLAGTSVTRREVSGPTLATLSDIFVNHADGERIRELRMAVDQAAARPATARLELIEVGSEPRGLIASEHDNGVLRVSLLRVSTGLGETTIGRHLLGLLRDQAVAAGLEVIHVVDRAPSAPVRRSFRDEGFASTSTGAIAHALTGRESLADLRRRAEALGSPANRPELLGEQTDDLGVRAAAAERWFAPVRVVGAGIQTFLVPIKHSFATALFDEGLSRAQLFDREWQLGLRRELVYFRSPRPTPRGFSAPARLLWYVSGRNQGGSTIRAVSHLTELAVDDCERLFYRFQPLGIYGLEDVRRCADAKNRAMALRFSHTELLDSPVSLDDYRLMVTGDAKSKRVPLQSPQRVDEHVFVSIMRLGSQRHD